MAHRCDINTGTMETVVSLVELFCEMDCQEVSSILLRRLLTPVWMTQRRLKSILLPLVGGLGTLISGHSILPLTEPFRTFFTKVVLAWGIDVLGAKLLSDKESCAITVHVSSLEYAYPAVIL